MTTSRNALIIIAACLSVLSVDSYQGASDEDRIKSRLFLHVSQNIATMTEGTSFSGVYASIGAFVVGLLVVIMLGSFVQASDPLNKFLYPGVTASVMGLFFMICTQAETLVVASEEEGGPSAFIGVYILVFIAVLLLAFNGIALLPEFNKYFQRRLRSKPNAMGVFLTLGAGAIIFGFLDNFGMKLGTDALEGKLFMSLGKSITGTRSAVSTDAGVKSMTHLINSNIHAKGLDEKPFEPTAGTVTTGIPNLEEHMATHIDILDDWSSKDYNKIINNAIRYAQLAKPDKFATGSPQSGDKEQLLNTLVDSILENELKPLELPSEWIQKGGVMDQDTQLGRDRSRIYMKDVRERFSTIKDASSMLGNTFSDFVGALLGAGVGKLFCYLTAIDGDVELAPDNNSFDANAIRFLQNSVVRVIMEAVFIGIGCLIPVWMHYSKRDADIHMTGVTTFEIPVLLFVLMCILVAGFLTEPVPDEDKSEDESNEEESRNETLVRQEFYIGSASVIVFSLGALISMLLLSKLDTE